MRMRSRVVCLSAAAAAVLFGGGGNQLQARSLTWDADGASGNLGADGGGNWDTVSPNWVDGDLVTGSNVTWVNSPADSATFGNGTNAYVNTATPNNIDFAEAITAQDITVGIGANGAVYNFTDFGGGSLTLQGNITKVAGNGQIQFLLPTNGINLAAGNHTIAMKDSPGDVPELSVNGIISGPGGITIDNSSATTQAWGTAVLNVDNTYTGVTNINMGRLVITTSGGLGDAAGGTVIDDRGTLSIGGAGTTVTGGGVTLSEPITIKRSVYSGGEFGRYGEAVFFANGSGTHTLNGALVVDSTDARIRVETSTVNINSSITAGPDVTPGAGVLTLDGDFAGFVNLNADNTAYGSAGNAIKIINGVEVSAGGEANLGGATSKLILAGGTIHPTGALASSAFMTNFGAHDLSATPVNTGLDLDAGQTFNVNNVSGGAIGTRGQGTINFSGANTFTGKPFFDAGTVNINDNISFGGFALRSPTFNIAPNVTLINATSTSNEAVVVAFDGSDTSTLNIASNLTFNDSGGLAIGDNASANGTVNTSGTLTVNNETWVGNGGGTGTLNMTGGTATLKNWFAIGRDVGGANGAHGTVNLSGGTITKQGGGHAYLGEASAGTGTMTVSLTGVYNQVSGGGEFWVGQGGGTGTLNIGTAVGATTNADAAASFTVNSWFAVGRNGGTGTVNVYDGTLTQKTSNFFDIGAGGTGTVNVFGGTVSALQTYVGENGSGSATLNVNGGDVTLGNTIISNADSVAGTINLNTGGTLTANQITAQNGGGTGTPTLKFNGGLLKANVDNTNFIGLKVNSIVSTGGASISSNGHNITINSVLKHDTLLGGADGGFTKSGAGTMIITGASTYTGPTSVTGGTLVLGNNLTTSSSVSVSNNSTLQIQQSTNFNRVIKTANVTVAAGSKLNIENNKLILTAQSVGSWNGSAYTGVTGLVASGYSPNQDFSGSGIVTAQSNATGGNTLTNIGVASNSDLGLGSFGGQTVGANDTLVMYTYGGDANLDGIINGDDYFQIDSAFPTNGHGWFNGDFNYDGVVNGDDYFVIDSNFPAQGTAIPTSGGVASAAPLAGVQAVPEPASIAFVGLATSALLMRRRRRNR